MQTTCTSFSYFSAMGRYEDNIVHRKKLASSLHTYREERQQELFSQLKLSNKYRTYTDELLKWIALYKAIEDGLETEEDRNILLDNERDYVTKVLETGASPDGYYSTVIKKYVDIPFSRIVDSISLRRQSSHKVAKDIDTISYTLLETVESYKKWLLEHKPDAVPNNLYRKGKNVEDLKKIYYSLLKEHLECSWDEFYAAVISNDYFFDPIVWKRDYLMLYTLFILLYNEVVICKKVNFTFDDFMQGERSNAQAFTKWINPRIEHRFVDTDNKNIKKSAGSLRSINSRKDELNTLAAIITN